MRNYYIKYYFVFFSVFVVSTLAAQYEKNGETSTFHYKDNPSYYYHIDTGLYNFEQYSLNQTDGWEYYDIGNTGMAQYAMTFSPKTKQGFQSGLSAFDHSKYMIGNIKYFKVNKPYSAINYSLGTKRENIFDAILAQNIKNRFEFGLDFRRVSSLGVYQNQRTRNSNLSFYSVIHSKNNRYHFGTDLIYNRIKVAENGGLVENFVETDTSDFANLLFYSTYLEEGAVTEQKNVEVLLSQQYDLGFSKLDNINDSTAVKKFHATWVLKQEFGIGRGKYNFEDIGPDVAYYGGFYQNSDSMTYDMKLRRIDNRLGVQYLGLKNKKDTLIYRPIWASFFVRHQHVSVQENDFDEVRFVTNNISLEGEFSSNPNRFSPVQYRAKVAYYVSGYNRHDIHLDAFLGYEIKKTGRVSGRIGFHSVAPSWISTFYFRQGQQWINSFDKEKSLTVGGDYSFKEKGVQLSFNYNLISDYVYFDEEAQPTQYDGALHYWNISFRKDFSWRTLHLDNFVGVQGVSDKEIVRIPTLFLKSSFYVQGKIFKGNMLAKVGVDMRYNSQFRVPDWQPAIGQFYLQDEQIMKQTPIMDVFISMQVRSLRIFIKANYVNKGLFVDDYFVARNYVSRGRTFAGGLSWRFFE